MVWAGCRPPTALTAKLVSCRVDTRGCSPAGTIPPERNRNGELMCYDTESFNLHPQNENMCQDKVAIKSLV